MSFATALSGLQAASTNLQVTGNNIANSQTVGFKESRAEFADVYASSIGGVSKTQPGSGVKVTEVAQQFKDGTIDPTSNSLDLALSGNGFFVLADTVNLPDPANPTAPVDPSVPTSYTRNGAFKLDSSGNVVNSQGKYLLAFAANGTTVAEGFSVGVFRPLTIDTSQGLPNSTENINLALTINGGATAPTTTVFDPTNALSYNNTTSITTYDSQGNAHIASTYYVKTPVANVWDAYLFLDDYGITTGGQAVPPAAAAASTVSATVNTPGLPIPMSFTSSGLLSEVGTRAAAVISAATVTAANTAVTDTTAADTAATATAGGSYTAALAATALTKAQTAAASAATLAADAAAANSTLGAAVAALAATAKTTAATAATAAAAYATSAALVVDGATGTTAAALAATAKTAAATAQTAVVAYNTAVAAAAAGATQATKVDFGSIDLSLINPNISVDPMAFDIDFAKTAQTTATFSVNNSSQDGLPAGNLTGIDVDDAGVVFARYSNGGSKTLGQVALARFQSNQSLAKLGDTAWAKTSSSGAPIYGAAGDNNFGTIQSSALESSTVDLSAQLVKLIIAQQAYQANSQTITTEKTLVETILRA
ncbi:flagellar hook protein FlgE [Methylobacter tundripaludum]|uniref:Flagellar hook protein FlgE n=2 Tax=Methylobacter tundripaludum TaxID=173365 RepID=G3ISV5_METTV|nr:flagellar hook protein FlgE [Methylobacter tundripaludum]EGW22429.1 flagellar hook-basal body protein [Methylobacter tundripaludum SV96]PPK77112.1 flagellar hook protein FlgE [Methylobacter tundripaludum]